MIKPFARVRRFKAFSKLSVIILVLYLTDNISIIRDNKEGYASPWLKISL